MTITKSDTSHVSIADNLQTLIDCKADMKSAIEEKGVTVSGGLSTYADAIMNINNGDDKMYLPVGTKFAYTDFNITDAGHIYPDINSVINLINPNETDMSYMFAHCYSLTAIPQLDTSNVTNMSRMFEYCRELTDIPQLDTSNVTNMSCMFGTCRVLTAIPQLDTSNVTNMSRMFEYCRELTDIPQLDTSNVTNMSDMFYYCQNLTSIPQLDTSNVTNMSNMLRYCYDLTDLGGFINMGSKSSFSPPTFSDSTELTKESIMNIINNLYDRKTAGYSIITLKFESTNLAKLTDEDIALATNKGWSIIS